MSTGNSYKITPLWDFLREEVLFQRDGNNPYSSNLHRLPHQSMVANPGLYMYECIMSIHPTTNSSTSNNISNIIVNPKKFLLPTESTSSRDSELIQRVMACDWDR